MAGEGRGGGQKYQNLLSEKPTKGKEGGHKIVKIGENFRYDFSYEF
jgi:hypothetical protein